MNPGDLNRFTNLFAVSFVQIDLLRWFTINKTNLNRKPTLKTGSFDSEKKFMVEFDREGWAENLSRALLFRDLRVGKCHNVKTVRV